MQLDQCKNKFIHAIEFSVRAKFPATTLKISDSLDPEFNSTQPSTDKRCCVVVKFFEE